MAKILMILFLTCVSIKNYAQILPHKTPSQNTHWLDSMKRIINKGFELNTQDKNNWKKQLIYVNTCTNLGRYYEWAYDKHYVKNMVPALKYYNKVIDLGRFPDEPIYFKALAIRTNIYRKLADIYYKGKGVRRDKKLSLEFALNGIGSNIKLVDFYSKRYYGTSINLSKVKQIESSNDSIFSFKASRFAIRANILDLSNIKKELENINKIYKQKKIKDSVEFLFEFYSEPTMNGQEFANTILRSLISLFIEKYKINSDNIITNNEVGVENNIILRIFIKKKPPTS